jgi:hypothetical protein
LVKDNIRDLLKPCERYFYCPRHDCRTWICHL